MTMQASFQDKLNVNYLDAGYMAPEDYISLGKMDIIKKTKSLVFFFKLDFLDCSSFINDTVNHYYDFKWMEIDGLVQG